MKFIQDPKRLALGLAVLATLALLGPVSAHVATARPFPKQETFTMEMAFKGCNVSTIEVNVFRPDGTALTAFKGSKGCRCMWEFKDRQFLQTQIVPSEFCGTAPPGFSL